MANRAIKSVTVLGATGSIGDSTLDVIARHPDRYRAFALTANSDADKLFVLLQKFQPRYAVLRDERAAERLHERVRAQGLVTQVLSGEAGLIEVASHADVDTVVAAIVGAAGLASTFAAVQAGKRILLANKEALVTAGHLFMDAVAASGSLLLPLDSEHNAIFQCLPVTTAAPAAQGLDRFGVSRILLTGSGGPFRSTALDQLSDVTPAQAIAHPNWSMGPKISVDSATMMNKGLELIEACWLFAATPEQIQIVVHPQSVVHSMVEYIDGSVLAQLGNPDMRTPIAHALAWPERTEAGVSPLDMIAKGRLDFQAPDYQRFPCLALATAAIRRGGTAPAALNAANEEAVAAFLAGRIRFTDIPAVIEAVLELAVISEPLALIDVQRADADARVLARAVIVQRSGRS